MAPRNASSREHFQCDLCGEEFDSVSELDEHKKGYHERPSRQARTENLDIQRDVGAAGLPGSPNS